MLFSEIPVRHAAVVAALNGSNPLRRKACVQEYSWRVPTRRSFCVLVRLVALQVDPQEPCKLFLDVTNQLCVNQLPLEFAMFAFEFAYAILECLCVYLLLCTLALRARI